MFEARTAFTTEIDEPENAVHEILERIRPDSLAANSIGLATCESEFMDSGAAKAICDALPFDVVGVNTSMSGTPTQAAPYQFSLMVLTGDDISFSTALSEPLVGDPARRSAGLGDMCAAAATNVDAPAMAFAYAPMFEDFNDEDLIAALDAASGGLPLFGTLAVNYEDGRYTGTRILHNGADYPDRACITYVSGNITPVFRMERLPENRILKQKAIITRSRGNILVEVNDMPVMQFMSSLGLVQNGQLIGIHSMPFILDVGPDSPPQSRSVLHVSPEGHVVCAGAMPVGATLALGAQDSDAVIDTTDRLLGSLAGHSGAKAAIFYSCHSRALALGLEEKAEYERVRRSLGESVPFVFAYSGGEIAPVNVGGALRNSSHSDTVVACMLA